MKTLTVESYERENKNMFQRSTFDLCLVESMTRLDQRTFAFQLKALRKPGDRPNGRTDEP